MLYGDDEGAAGATEGELLDRPDISNEEILRLVDARGLNPGVTTRDLVELMWGVKNDDMELCKKVIRRLSRQHLGKII